jgi:hypothetical protein
MIKRTFTILAGISIVFFIWVPVLYAQDEKTTPWWSVQSVDTMKYSRDLSREKLHDNSFDTVIDTQLRNIASVGSTHVAIATPYDEEFVPILWRWVTAARKYKLKVWFRGNFSGWEKWFDYPRMSRDEHLRMTKEFIKANASIFEDGDIFTPCPECENGGPGDPRQTGDTEGHRLFLIASYTAASTAFQELNKHVEVGYFSMNYDVAKVIMDKRTTAALGGIVTIDHYITSANQIASDARAIAEHSGGKVFIGEFGAPIPDLHGRMTEDQQEKWIADALQSLALEPSVIGVNYWVNIGGSTQLWSSDGSPKKGVQALQSAYKPKQIIGHVINQHGNPIMNAEVSNQYKTVKTDNRGYFSLPVLDANSPVIGKYNDYPVVEIHPDGFQGDTTIVIPTNDKSLWELFLGFFKRLFLL